MHCDALMMKKLTTKTQLNKFKRTFLKYARFSGYGHWTFFFKFEETESSGAHIVINEQGCVATLTFARTEVEQLIASPEEYAKHEFVHLLVNRLYLAFGSEEPNQEWVLLEVETLVCKISKLLKETSELRRKDGKKA